MGKRKILNGRGAKFAKGIVKVFCKNSIEKLHSFRIFSYLFGESYLKNSYI